MENKKLTTSVIATLLLSTNLFSQETTSLEPITITSSSIQTDEKTATFATEIYTKDDIEKSKSKDIYDFLSSQTSVNVSPSYGNTFSQQLDLRGYGISDGYENIVVLVNGRKLNNVDMVPQLLSSISLENVEKIEIIKGSGSVSYGDGANAGVINIITNSKNDNYIKAYVGNHGTKNGTLSLGYDSDNLIVNGYIDYTSTDGSITDPNDEKDENYNKNKNINIIYFPIDNLELNLSRSYSNMNIKYGSSITKDQYEDDPSDTSSFTEQYFSSYVTTAGLKYDINSKLSFDASFSDEDKTSEYITYSSISNYDYKSFSSKLNYKDEIFKFALGVDGFDGDRIGSYDTTNKTNKAIFVSGEYKLTKDLNLSAGFRRENVEYTYNPDSGDNEETKNYLNAYDIGINYQLDENSSIFANYNRSFQAPDIDRFFTYGSFNEFIEPAKVKNYTIGYNNFQKNNKLKVSLFRSELTNEIYLSPYSYSNTNIDKSHKYGIEIYDKYIINKNLYTSINYSYIVAKIDHEDEKDGAYDGKDLPGVSRHNITLNLGFNINNINTVLSHTYRSEAYAANDFENNFDQKQEAYNSTDLAITYKYQNLELFAKIQNLFDRKNGLWISDDVIYPINYETTYYAGLKVSF